MSYSKQAIFKLVPVCVVLLFAGSVVFYAARTKPARLDLSAKKAGNKQAAQQEEQHSSYEEPPPLPLVKVIEIKNCQFVPNPLTVKENETIAWENEDSVPHTIISALEETEEFYFNTGDIKPHATISAVSYSKVGTYSYYCKEKPNEKGTIIVEE
jgi:plastocyanin